MTDTPASGNYIELTAQIVSAYVSNNTVPAGEIPSLINQASHQNRVAAAACRGEFVLRHSCHRSL